MPSIKVKCPDSLQNHCIPAFGITFCAGVHEISDPDLVRFLLKYPSKNIPVDPQEVADLKILSPEEVAGFGFEIVAKDQTGKPILDKETGKPALVDPDFEKAAEFEVPEGIPTDDDFAKMGIAELRDFLDDPEHPGKYETKWKKEQYVKACCRIAKKLRK